MRLRGCTFASATLQNLLVRRYFTKGEKALNGADFSYRAPPSRGSHGKPAGKDLSKQEPQRKFLNQTSERSLKVKSFEPTEESQRKRPAPKSHERKELDRASSASRSPDFEAKKKGVSAENAFFSQRVKCFWTEQTPRFNAPLYASTFEDFGLPSAYIQNLKAEFGIDRPTEMQISILRNFLAGKDIFLRCSTGTGKSFALLLAQLLFHHHNSGGLRTGCVSSLLVVPTVPLAHQIVDWASRITGLGSSSAELRRIIQPCVPRDFCRIDHDGTAISDPAIVVGVPRQLAEQSSDYDFSNLRVFVLDEADSVLQVPNARASEREQKNFKLRPHRAVRILEHFAREVWLDRRPLFIASSATLNAATKEYLKTLGLDADVTSINSSDLPPAKASVSHRYLMLDPRLDPEKEPQKFLDHVVDSIASLYDEEPGQLGFLFLGSHSGKDRIKKMLEDRMVKIGFIQDVLLDRETGALADDPEFLKTPGGLLIGSETETYGLDLSILKYVIIVGVPESFRQYLHLSGRVGRLGGKLETRVVTVVGDRRGEESLLEMLKTNNVPIKKMLLANEEELDVDGELGSEAISAINETKFL